MAPPAKNGVLTSPKVDSPGLVHPDPAPGKAPSALPLRDGQKSEGPAVVPNVPSPGPANPGGLVHHNGVGGSGARTAPALRGSPAAPPAIAAGLRSPCIPKPADVAASRERLSFR